MPTFEHRWKDYTDEELLTWVHLYTKRAGHRTNPVKKMQDLDDAVMYFDVLMDKKRYENGLED